MAEGATTLEKPPTPNHCKGASHWNLSPIPTEKVAIIEIHHHKENCVVKCMLMTSDARGQGISKCGIDLVPEYYEPHMFINKIAVTGVMDVTIKARVKKC